LKVSKLGKRLQLDQDEKGNPLEKLGPVQDFNNFKLPSSLEKEESIWNWF
jgi:hypothetical protein